MDVFEAMSTARSMRWLKSDPVPDELVEKLLWAATRASSAHNSQPWHFVVLRDGSMRAQFAAAIRQAAEHDNPLPAESESRTDRLIDAGVRNLFANLGEAPVLVVICGENSYPHGAPDPHFMNNAIAAAGQNLIVAARALGLGATFTMLHQLAEPRLRKVLGLPDDISIGATIPVGWPQRSFGPVKRLPLAEVVHYDGW
jgi:nitroreductase